MRLGIEGLNQDFIFFTVGNIPNIRFLPQNIVLKVDSVLFIVFQVTLLVLFMSFIHMILGMFS